MLLVESDPEFRVVVGRALRSAGFAVTEVSRIAEIVRWPSGQIVMTDRAHFSPWWKHIGATHVVVFVDTEADGLEIAASGAIWVLREEVLRDWGVSVACEPVP